MKLNKFAVLGSIVLAAIACIFVTIGYKAEASSTTLTDPAAYTVTLESGLQVNSAIDGENHIALSFLEGGVGTVYTGDLPASLSSNFYVYRSGTFGSSTMPETLLVRVTMTSPGMTVYLKGATYDLLVETEAIPGPQLDCYRDGLCNVVITDAQWWRCFRCCFFRPTTCLPH